MSLDVATRRRQLECAVHYLLAEVPLFADAAGIVGAETSVFCYHHGPLFLRDYYRGELAVRPSERQGLAMLAYGHGSG